MEGEEDPWAGMGVDEAEETSQGISANAESWAEEATDQEEEWSELHEDWEDPGQALAWTMPTWC